MKVFRNLFFTASLLLSRKDNCFIYLFVNLACFFPASFLLLSCFFPASLWKRSRLSWKSSKKKQERSRSIFNNIMIKKYFFQKEAGKQGSRSFSKNFLLRLLTIVNSKLEA